MELDELEKRHVTLELPPAVWEVIDGANGMATEHAGQDFEKWLSEYVVQAVVTCLRLAETVRDEMSVNSPGGRA